MKNILAQFLILILGTGVLYTSAEAQETDKGIGGSSYSVFGIGNPLDLTSDNFKGQGITGVSGVTPEYASLSNPALWGQIIFSQAVTGLNYSKYTLKNGASNNENLDLASGYFHFLFPLSKRKLGLSLSLYPSTRMGFHIDETSSFISSALDTVNYSNDIISSGGMNKIELGLGFKLTKNIYLGYAPSVAFLNINNEESFTFSAASFNAQNQSKSYTGAALSHRFGISANFMNLLGEEDRLTFGGTLNLPFQINAESEFSVQKVINGVEQSLDYTSTLPVSEGEIQLPLESSFGIAYEASRFVNFALEGTFQKWSDYKSEIDPASENVMKDRLKVGFGGQFHPYKRNSNSFFSSFKYSGGLSYDTGHLTVQGNDINTLWINTGLGIRARNLSTIDISFQYGFRGTNNSNLIKEQIWALGFSVNLAELMFIRPKLR